MYSSYPRSGFAIPLAFSRRGIIPPLCSLSGKRCSEISSFKISVYTSRSKPSLSIFKTPSEVHGTERNQGVFLFSFRKNSKRWQAWKIGSGFSMYYLYIFRLNEWKKKMNVASKGSVYELHCNEKSVYELLCKKKRISARDRSCWGLAEHKVAPDRECEATVP